jgi:chlorite dismutase
MSHFENSIMPSASRALVARDVQTGTTWYVSHVDTDRNIIRHHGPMCEEFARKLAQNFNNMGHVGTAIDTPERIKKALA